jgi:hypothetical protein
MTPARTVGADDANRPLSPWTPLVDKIGVPIMWITVGILIDRFLIGKKKAV